MVTLCVAIFHMGGDQCHSETTPRGHVGKTIYCCLLQPNRVCSLFVFQLHKSFFFYLVSCCQGDTIENVANELQHILSTGIYHFQLATDSNILLIYQTMQMVRTHRRTGSNAQPLEESGEGGSNGHKHGLITLPTVYPSPLPSTLDVKKEEPFANTMGYIEQRWSIEQIADFVRKLGFLDTKQQGGDTIRKFLHLNSVSIVLFFVFVYSFVPFSFLFTVVSSSFFVFQTANKMMDLFMKLYELGHPNYQKHRSLPPLLCNTQAKDADEMVTPLFSLVFNM